MKTPYGHLTYCTNIHQGESWQEHFNALQENIPLIKHKIAPDIPMGIGLRLSNLASLQLSKEESLTTFKNWLHTQQCYVFTINGFPYGSFHAEAVKDNVHRPDWTTSERVQYTIRLGRILAALLPEGSSGGISTSPLSYKYWHQKDEKELVNVIEKATLNMMQVVEQFVRVKQSSGILLHLDVEPEPDGIIENSTDFLNWYHYYLLQIGIPYLVEKFQYSETLAEQSIREHVQICYDVCHFAVSYENHAEVLQQLETAGIRVGKFQLSAALKIILPLAGQEREIVTAALQPFNEPVYLHQVIARSANGNLLHYPDLPQALIDLQRPSVEEWRAHYHVPLFWMPTGLLQSTQNDVVDILKIQRERLYTSHLEVETYTWEILPKALKLSLPDSIIRELEWVKNNL